MRSCGSIRSASCFTTGPIVRTYAGLLEGLLLRDYAQAQLEQNARGGHALTLHLHRAPVPWAPSVPVSPRANGVEIERQRLGIGRLFVVLAVFDVASSPAPWHRKTSSR